MKTFALARHRSRVLAGLLGSLLVAAFCQNARALDVPLQVAEPAGVARSADPCRTGVPLAPGSLTDEKKLRVLDDKGVETAAQFQVISRREAGDVEWVSVNFLADVAAKGTASYHLVDSGPAKPTDKPVTVDDGKDALTVINGPLKLVLPKAKFSGLGEVWLDRDGNGKFEQVSKGGSLTIEGVDGKVYRTTSDLTAPLKVSLEEQGPILVVVRIDGEVKAQSADGKDNFYPSWDGKESHKDGVKMADKDFSLGFTVRLHIWKGQTFVRAFVTMRNLKGSTNAWTDSKIQFGEWFAHSVQQAGNGQVDAVNMDLDLTTTANLKYKIGGGIDGSEVHSGDLAESKGQVTLYQDSSASWLWQNATGKIYDPRLARNKEMVKADVTKAGRPDAAYWEFEPAIFNLLTKRDGCSFMGYRLYQGANQVKPSSSSSFEDLGKEVAEGMRAPGWVEVDDGTTAVTVGCRWFWQTFPKSIELKAPGTISMGLWSRYLPRGHLFEGTIHKTHELVFDFHASGKGLGGAERFAAFHHRLIACPDARHNLASRAYGDFMLPNAEEWPRYEKSALAAVVSCLDTEINPGRSSSMEIEREKMDVYDVWKFGDSMKDSWHHFGQYEELDIPYCLMVHFARTGDRRFYDEAEIATRELLDVPAHGGGYGHQCGEPSHYYVIGPMMFSCFTAEPFLKDSVQYMHDQVFKETVWHLRSFAISLWSNQTMLHFFPQNKDEYLKRIGVCLDYWNKVQVPETGELKGYTSDRAIAVFLFGLATDALGRYCEAFPAEKDYRTKLVKACAEWRTYYKNLGDKRVPMQSAQAANGLAYAARFSGDPTFLDFVFEFLVNDKIFSIDYRTGVSSAKTWSEHEHRLIQTFLHDYDKRKHPEKYKDLP